MVRQDREPRESEAAVREAARSLDQDRYLAALLGPACASPALLALAAFHGEIARIPLTVHEPAMGDIRLQWWRDAVALPADEATGHPVADTFRRVMCDHALNADLIDRMIDAYARLLEPDTLASLGAIDAHAEATQGAVFRLGVRILDASAWQQPLVSAAGLSYGYVQLLRAAPALIANGRDPFGNDGLTPLLPVLLRQARVQLANARQLATSAPRSIRSAFLPVALVEPYLTALEGLGSRVAGDRADISALRRSWRLLKASALGRL